MRSLSSPNKLVAARNRIYHVYRVMRKESLSKSDLIDQAEIDCAHASRRSMRFHQSGPSCALHPKLGGKVIVR